MSIEPAEHLTAAIEQLSDDINGLMQVAEEGTLLKQLVDEVKVLREAIDDLRCEVEWAMRNIFQNVELSPLPKPITSMPLDPCDPAFAAKLNAVSRHDLPTDGDEPMFDDDAEYFREDNDYPEDDLDEEEESDVSDTSSPSSERSSMDATATPVPSPQTHPSSSQPQPPAIEAPTHPPTPSPTATAPQSLRTDSPVAAPAERTVSTKKQPLATRLFLHRHMADLVRLIGHREHLAEDLQHMVQPLFEKYGTETVKSAIDDIVHFEHRDRQAYARLKADVIKLSVQIIGRPTSVR